MGLAVGAMALGGVMSASSQAQSQASANVANEYNARIQERNAQIADIKADEAIRLGKSRAAKQAGRGKQIIGSQRTGFAASGVVVDNGSAMDVVKQTMDATTQDALMERHNAAKEAWSIKEQAKGMRGQADLSRMQKRDSGEVFTSSLLTQGLKTGGAWAMNKGF